MRTALCRSGGWVLVLWLSILCPGWAQQRTYVWAVSGGGTNYDSGNCVATDRAGNVYQAGLFGDTASFGRLTLTAQTGMLDVFLAKYTPQGQVLWVRQISGNNIKSVRSLAVDATGEAVLTGDYTSPSLPPTATPVLTLDHVTLTGGSVYGEMYVARYDAQGQVLWANQTRGQGTNGTKSEGTDVALAADGSTYLTGYYGGSGPVLFNQLTASITPSYSHFLAKYDHAGQLLWLRDNLPGVRAESGPQVAVSPSQEVYFLGQFNQSASLGALTLTNTSLIPAYFLATLDAQGTFLTARQDIIAPQEACRDLAVSAKGNVIFACTYQGTAQHGTQQFTSVNGVNPLLLSFSTRGDFQWGQTASSTAAQGDEQISPVTLDEYGNIYTVFANQGFVVKSYSPMGTLRWSHPSPALVTSLVVSAPDHVVLTGLFERPAVFTNTTLGCRGEVDAFVAKLEVTGVPTLPTGEHTSLFVPNIITPNQDGWNDCFRVRGLPTGPWQLRVYSRWGQLVYHTLNYQQDWEAPSLADGVYFYYLQHSTQPPIKGWVEVLH